MISTTVTHNLDALNAMLDQYRQVSKRTNEHILVKQGNKLGFELRSRLRVLAPAVGSIKTERIAALRGGGGIHIRKSVKESVNKLLGLAYGRSKDGKLVRDVWVRRGRKTPRMAVAQKVINVAYGENGERLSAQAIKVKRELRLRERGRGFLSIAGSVRPKSLVGGGETSLRGRYRQLLATAKLQINLTEQSLTFSYGGKQSAIGDAMSTPKADTQVAGALQAVTTDMASYVADKQAKALAKQTGGAV